MSESENLSRDDQIRIDAITSAYAVVARANYALDIRTLIEAEPSVTQRPLLKQLLVAELRCQRERGETLNSVIIRQQLHEFADVVDDAFGDVQGETPTTAATTAKDDDDLERTSANSQAGEGVTEQSGTTIGRYKLLQPVGEGGMGSVWMAEQREPVRPVVALTRVFLRRENHAVAQ